MVVGYECVNFIIWKHTAIPAMYYDFTYIDDVIEDVVKIMRKVSGIGLLRFSSTKR